MPDNVTLKDVNRVYPGSGLPLLSTSTVDDQNRRRGSGFVDDELDQPEPASVPPRTIAALIRWHEESHTYEQTATDDDAEHDQKIDAARLLHEEIVFIGRSLRRSLTRPTTPLHVMLIADGLSIPEIAGRMRSDPSDVELHIAQLVSAGVVAEDKSGVVPRYSVIGLSGE